MTDPLRQWPRFTRAVRDRLDAGQRAYGDRSFSRHPAELLEELQQEALDMAGWGFVLYTRLQAAVDAVSGADPAQGAPEPKDAPETLPALDMVALELTLLIQPHEAAMLMALAQDFGWVPDGEIDRAEQMTIMRRVVRHAFTTCFRMVFRDRFKSEDCGSGAGAESEQARLVGAARGVLDDGKRFCSVCRRHHGPEVVHPCE